MKKTITESQLRDIIKESVKKVLNEVYNSQDDNEKKEFMDWVQNYSQRDTKNDIFGYYQANRKSNESLANRYMDKILSTYAEAKECEISQLNRYAIESAINEWGDFYSMRLAHKYQLSR